MSNATEKGYYVALVTKGGNVVTGDLTRQRALEIRDQYEQDGKKAIVTTSFQEAHGL